MISGCRQRKNQSDPIGLGKILDPFEEVWANVEKRLSEEPSLKAVTLFQWLQDEFPGKFADSTRRTFERRVAKWRAISGPDKQVFFSQVHTPGRVAASDFTVP